MENYYLRIYYNDSEYVINSFDIDNISLNFSLKDIKQPESRKTSFSKPIKIYRNNSTSQIFKNLFNITNNDSFDTRIKVNIKLFESNNIVINGYMIVDKVYNDYYSVVLFNNNLGIFTDVGDKYLSDLYFPNTPYIHNITKLHIYNQWTSVFNEHIQGTGLYYPLIDYYGISHKQDLAQDYPILPSVGAWELLNKIKSDNGYTFDISTDVSNIIKKLYIPYNGDYTQFTTDYHFYRGTLSGQTANVPLNKPLYLNKVYNYLNNSNYEFYYAPYKLHTSASYTFKLGIIGKKIVNDENLQAIVKPVIVINKQEQQTQLTFSGGTEYVGDSNEYKFTQYGVYETFNCEVTLDIEKESTFQIKFNTDNENYLVIDHLSILDITFNNYLYANPTQYNINHFLPVGYKQKDFLLDIVKMFNLHVYSDEIDSKKLFFKTYDEYYNNEVLDWSNKIDDNNLNFKDLTATLNKNYIFELSSGEDTYSKDFQDKYNENIYTHKVTNTNETLSNDSESKISLSFPPSTVNRPFFNVDLLRIDEGFMGKPRMIFLRSVSLVQPGATPVFDVFEGEVYTVLSILTATNFINNTYSNTSNNLFLGFDLNKTYFNPVNTDYPTVSAFSNLTLYNKYYNNEIEHLLNGNNKLLSVKALLNSSDIKTENFRKNIFINNSKLGGSGVYRINQIKNYKNSNSLCDVELIKIDESYDTSYESTITPTILFKSILTESKNGGSGGGSSSGGGNTSVDLTNYYTKPAINTYTGNTNTAINNKLNTSLFNSFSGNTYTKAQTQSLIVNKYLPLSGGTVTYLGLGGANNQYATKGNPLQINVPAGNNEKAAIIINKDGYGTAMFTQYNVNSSSNYGLRLSNYLGTPIAANFNLYNGNVSIGTSQINAAKLYVSGNTTTTGNIQANTVYAGYADFSGGQIGLGNYFSINTSSESTGNLWLQSLDGTLINYMDYTTQFYSNDVEKMQINTSGVAITGTLGVNGNTTITGTLTVNGNIVSTGEVCAYGAKATGLDTAPASMTATGTIGERRFCSDGMYVCIAANTWRKLVYTTF